MYLCLIIYTHKKVNKNFNVTITTKSETTNSYCPLRLIPSEMQTNYYVYCTVTEKVLDSTQNPFMNFETSSKLGKEGNFHNLIKGNLIKLSPGVWECVNEGQYYQNTVF